jgi:hypothetical protein
LEVEEVQAANENASDSSEKVEFKLKYRLLFEPLRTFSSSAEILVTCKNKGRWKISVDMMATDPDPDDIINLTAAVGGSDKISFRLNNRFLGYSPFQAYLTAKSSPYFSVSPSSGVLAPFGNEGTLFVVTYTPLEYGAIDR